MKRSIINDKDNLHAQTRKEYIDELDKAGLRYVLDDDRGRWFLMRLFDSCGLHRDCFTGNSQSFYLEGKRSIGTELYARMVALGLDGVKLRHQAETEYVSKQLAFDGEE